MCSDFRYNFLYETFLVLRIIERDMIINVYSSNSCQIFNEL
jgi:hypothetical protein